jgi:hypothetical protein
MSVDELVVVSRTDSPKRGNSRLVPKGFGRADMKAGEADSRDGLKALARLAFIGHSPEAEQMRLSSLTYVPRSTTRAKFYSCRNATMGSTHMARRAGM